MLVVNVRQQFLVNIKCHKQGGQLIMGGYNIIPQIFLEYEIRKT